MPNEIKEPKVLKETTKQVYDFMKAENLLFEFDRKQVLRLIIEALSVEDINAMKNAKDEQERKKIYQNLMKKYHPDKNPDNKDDGPVDIQKLEKLLNDPQKFADIYIRDAKRAGKDMPSDEEEAKKLSDEQMVNIIRSVLAKLNTNPKTKKPYTPEEKTADLALKLINDNIKSGNVLLSKFIRIAKTKYGENFQDKFKQIITSATEGWKQQTTGIDPEDQKRVNAFAEKVQAAFKPVIDKIAEAFKKTELFSDPDWVGNLYDILQQNKLNEEVTDEEVLKFVGLKADPDGKLAGEQSQNLGKIVQALKKLKQKMIKDVEAYMEGGEEPDLEETILRVVKETLREQQIDPEGDDNIEAISTWQSKNNEFYEKAQKFLKGEYDGKGLEGLQSSFQSLGKPVLSEANYNQKEWFKGKKTGVFKSISEKNLNEAAFLLRGEIEKWTQGIENAMNELRKSIDSKPDRKAIGALKQRLRVWIDIYGTAEKILENYAGTDTEKKQELTPQKKEQLINVAKDATMFVKAYELIQKTLSKLLGVKPPEEIVIPDMQKLINPPKGEISPVIDDDPVVDDDPVKKDEQEDFGFAIERETFLSWYEDGTLPAATQNESLRRLNEQEKGLSTLQTIEDFEEGFVTEPMLQMQSMIFRNLYSNLLKLEDREFLMKFPQASLTAPRTPDEIEQTRGQQLKEEEEEKKEGVPFDEEDIQVFKDEYNNLLRLAKKLKTEVLALNIEEIETLGGAKVVDDARSIAVELQESLGKVHDTVENELSQFIDAGKKMNEAQEFDTETNQEKSEKREQNRQDRGKKVVGVYKAVRGYMTKLDQLVRKNESGAIDGKDLFMYASEARAELDKIKSFFPSFAPLGKMVDNPEKMIKQLKRFAKGLVRDIMDVVEQLRGDRKSVV